MNSFLRQSTASQSRAIGPFHDETDFKTPLTGLTISNTDIKLIINGAASADKNSGGGTHRANGWYGVTFDATDTATVGEMHVSVVEAGALPVFHTFIVVEEAVYDAMFAASALGPLTDAVLTEPSGVFAWASATPSNILRWVYALARNRITQTATVQTLRNDANSSDLSTSTHSDDGTTHVRGEWS